MYSPIISKHRTQINLSSPKKVEIRNGIRRLSHKRVSPLVERSIESPAVNWDGFWFSWWGGRGFGWAPCDKCRWLSAQEVINRWRIAAILYVSTPSYHSSIHTLSLGQQYNFFSFLDFHQAWIIPICNHHSFWEHLENVECWSFLAPSCICIKVI